MRNFIYSSFSSQHCSLGNPLNLLLPALGSSSSVCGSSFFRDSQVCNDQHLGSFAPLSSIDILHPPNLNYLHPPPGSGLQTSPAAMNETVSHPGSARFTHMRRLVDQFAEAEPFQNERNPSIVKPEMSSPPMNNCGSEFENSRKRKAISAEDDQQHPTDEPPLETQQQEQRVPVRRSQKIGDRITALQKLVSPFGKTDTASVLQEASAYIKLLQEQIQMLSTPYFRVESLPQQAFGGRLTDLRSRGLCLVPVSFTRNIINQNSRSSVDRSISRRTVTHRNY